MNKEEQEILDLKNPGKSYWYCFYNKEKANIKEHEKIILESKDAWYVYWFAKDIPKANIKELEKVILESKDVVYVYWFAKDIPGANIKEHEKVVLESKDLYYAYYFAKYISGANLELFKDILENSGYKEEFANLYSKYKKNQMTKEEQEILDLKDPGKSYWYCYYNKKAANIKEHEKIILESKDAHYAYMFANNISGENIKEHEKIILESKDAEYAYYFAKNVLGANIKEHEKVILESKDVVYAYYFAKYISGANIELFKDILENSEYKEKFANLYSEYKKNKTKNENFDNQSNFNKEKPSNSDVDFFTKNLIEGAYAGVATIAVDNVKKGLLAAAKTAGVDEVSIGIASMFLDTQFGKIILSILVGSGVRFIPVDIIQENPHLQKIADKCIQSAGSEGTQYIFNFATSFILPALLNAIQSTPELNSKNKVRVSSISKEEEFDNSDFINTTFKQANASL